MMEPKDKRICKRCLLKDIAPEEYLKNMKIYLQGLGEDIKAGETIYQDRLSKCEECDNLKEGICRICGCFVEYRAAIKIRSCPDLHPKW